MIHLLRKFRNELLKNNRLKQYFVYAFGEIFLVMIGIILALQFSNWNQKRNDTKKEIWYLDNIANDMFYQQNNLKELKLIFEENLSVCKGLLRDFSKTKNYNQIDSLSFKLNKLMVSYSYPNINNTYRELLSSGQVSLIENDSLITNIIDYYLTTSEIETTFKINEQQVFYGEIYPVLNKYVEIDIKEFTDDDTLEIKNDEIIHFLHNQIQSTVAKLELTNAIKNKLIITTDYLLNIEESLDYAEKMIKDIDVEIDRLK